MKIVVCLVLSFLLFLFSPFKAKAASILFEDNFTDSDGTVLSIHNPHWSFVNFQPSTTYWGEYKIYGNKATDGDGTVYSSAKLDISLPSSFSIETSFLWHPDLYGDNDHQHFIDIRINGLNEDSNIIRFWLLANGLTLNVYSKTILSSSLGHYSDSELNTIKVNFDSGIYTIMINDVSALTFSDTTLVPNFLIINQSVNSALLTHFVVQDLSVPDPSPSPTPAPTPTPTPVPMNCVMSEWGACSVSCGGGTQTRTIIQQPENGGQACGVTSQTCNTQACPTPVPTPTPFPITFFSQRDPAWKDQLYDSAQQWSPGKTKMENWGCAVTSASIVLDHYGIHQLPGGLVNNPGNLNSWLKTQADGYLRGGSVNWNAVSRATKLVSTDTIPTLEYRYKGNDPSDLKNRLNNSQPVILNEPGHFITAYQYHSGSDITDIVDPYWTTGPGARTTLSAYGNTFLSMRTFTPSHTDLGYLIGVTDTNIVARLYRQIGSGFTEVTDVNSYLQAPLIDPVAGIPASSESLRLLEYAKPDTGIYELRLHRDNPGYGKSEIYLYDSLGNPSITSQNNLFGTGDLVFLVQFGENGPSTPEKQVDFKFLRQEILTGKSLSYFKRPYRGQNLLEILETAQRLYPRFRKQSKVLITIMVKIFPLHKRYMIPQFYDTLRNDLNLLLDQMY